MSRITCEVRLNDDGETVDEILIFLGEKCFFHLEQMDTNAYWFAVDREDGKQQHFDLTSKGRIRLVSRGVE